MRYQPSCKRSLYPYYTPTLCTEFELNEGRCRRRAYVLSQHFPRNSAVGRKFVYISRKLTMDSFALFTVRGSSTRNLRDLIYCSTINTTILLLRTNGLRLRPLIEVTRIVEQETVVSSITLYKWSVSVNSRKMQHCRILTKWL